MQRREQDQSRLKEQISTRYGKTEVAIDPGLWIEKRRNYEGDRGNICILEAIVSKAPLDSGAGKV